MSGSAPLLSKGELGQLDRLNWELGNIPSSYTPVEYINPWDTEEWGANDVIVTAPRKIDVEQEKFDQRPIIPGKPGFQQGQRDYVYMPTEKEQRRERRAQARDLAAERTIDWRTIPLPGPVEKPPKEKVYSDWRETKIPERREVTIQPIPRREVTIQPIPRREREWGESRPDEMYIQVEGPGNPSWEERNPRRERAFDVRSTGRGFNTSATQPLSTDSERISLLSAEPRREEQRSRPVQFEPRREPVTSSNVMRGFGGGGLSDVIKHMVHRIDANRRY